MQNLRFYYVILAGKLTELGDGGGKSVPGGVCEPERQRVVEHACEPRVRVKGQDGDICVGEASARQWGGVYVISAEMVW